MTKIQHTQGLQHSFWVWHHCRVWNSLSDVLKVPTTNKTHDVITMLCVKNMYVEVNTCVTLWSVPHWEKLWQDTEPSTGFCFFKGSKVTSCFFNCSCGLQKRKKSAYYFSHWAKLNIVQGVHLFVGWFDCKTTTERISTTLGWRMSLRIDPVPLTCVADPDTLWNWFCIELILMRRSLSCVWYLWVRTMEIMIPSAGFCDCSGDLELCIISYGCFNTWRPLYKVPFIAVLLRSMHPTEGCQRVLIEVILTLTF